MFCVFFFPEKKELEKLTEIERLGEWIDGWIDFESDFDRNFQVWKKHKEKSNRTISNTEKGHDKYAFMVLFFELVHFDF